MKKNKLITEKIKRYCANQERSKYDVIQKMNQIDLNQTEKDKIIQLLIDEDYLNEKRFCSAFVLAKFKLKKWGKKKITFELQKKSISKDLINKCINRINLEEYYSVLKDLLIKKNSSLVEKNIFKRKKKIANFLIQRGFESSLVWENMKELDN